MLSEPCLMLRQNDDDTLYLATFDVRCVFVDIPCWHALNDFERGSDDTRQFSYRSRRDSLSLELIDPIPGVRDLGRVPARGRALLPPGPRRP